MIICITKKRKEYQMVSFLSKLILVTKLYNSHVKKQHSIATSVREHATQKLGRYLTNYRAVTDISS